MRLLFVIIFASVLFAAPPAAAEETDVSADTGDASASSGSATTTSSGPEPSGCRPYCLSA